MEKSALKERVCHAIDSRRQDIIRIGKTILNQPEMGFKEEKTAALVKEVFSSLGLEFESEIAVTGVKATAKGRSSRLTAAVIGELDAVISPAHPTADPRTGAAHACGHNAQSAAMLGAACGLVLSGAMGELDGDVAFMAVPAEEFAELEYREQLKKNGVIRFFGGKQEFIRLGAFNDIDLAMMVHSQGGVAERKAFIHGKGSGFIGKTVRFAGREAHAGGAPEEGINALNAAMVALMCIHVQREVFKDEDGIRVHPIITKGGDLVNIVPADVRMETYVRGKSLGAILSANEKVNRAIRAGAYSTGAGVEINEIPGYLPLSQDRNFGELFALNAESLISAESVIRGVDMIGSTDMGDLSALMPVIQPTMGGFRGQAHSREFEIADEDAAYIVPAKAMAMTVVDLLADGASGGRKIKSGFTPAYQINEYLGMWHQFETPQLQVQGHI